MIKKMALALVLISLQTNHLQGSSSGAGTGSRKASTKPSPLKLDVECITNLVATKLMDSDAHVVRDMKKLSGLELFDSYKETATYIIEGENRLINEMIDRLSNKNNAADVILEKIANYLVVRIKTLQKACFENEISKGDSVSAASIEKMIHNIGKEWAQKIISTSSEKFLKTVMPYYDQQSQIERVSDLATFLNGVFIFRLPKMQEWIIGQFKSYAITCSENAALQLVVDKLMENPHYTEALKFHKTREVLETLHQQRMEFSRKSTSRSTFDSSISVSAVVDIPIAAVDTQFVQARESEKQALAKKLAEEFALQEKTKADELIFQEQIRRKNQQLMEQKKEEDAEYKRKSSKYNLAAILKSKRFDDSNNA